MNSVRLKRCEAATDEPLACAAPADLAAQYRHRAALADSLSFLRKQPTRLEPVSEGPPGAEPPWLLYDAESTAPRFQRALRPWELPVANRNSEEGLE